MNNAIERLSLLALGGALLLTGCRDMSAKNAVAVYAAGPYSERIALRPDGRYVQTETQRGVPRLPGTQAIPPKPPPMTFQQTGAWRLLDGPHGKPLPLPTSPAALPSGAVVELKAALPFGLTWENRPPSGLQADRVIPAAEFEIPH